MQRSRHTDGQADRQTLSSFTLSHRSQPADENSYRHRQTDIHTDRCIDRSRAAPHSLTVSSQPIRNSWQNVGIESDQCVRIYLILNISAEGLEQPLLIMKRDDLAAVDLGGLPQCEDGVLQRKVSVFVCCVLCDRHADLVDFKCPWLQMKQSQHAVPQCGCDVISLFIRRGGMCRYLFR